MEMGGTRWVHSYEREGVEWRGVERVMQDELAWYG